MGGSLKIADIPDGEKPRERLIRLGPSALSDRELLAAVIRGGGRGKSALEVADELIASAGGLGSLAGARVEDLQAVRYLGPAKAAGLSAVFEIGRRAAMSQDVRPFIRGPEELAALCEPRLRGKRQEEALVVVLNSANRVLNTVVLSKGSVDRCLILARDVLSTVLRNDGVAFAVAHNHSSGDPTPSAEDFRNTQALKKAADAVGLRFLDHLVVGSGTCSIVNGFP